MSKPHKPLWYGRGERVGGMFYEMEKSTMFITMYERRSGYLLFVKISSVYAYSLGAIVKTSRSL